MEIIFQYRSVHVIDILVNGKYFGGVYGRHEGDYNRETNKLENQRSSLRSYGQPAANIIVTYGNGIQLSVYAYGPDVLRTIKTLAHLEAVPV